MPFPNLVAFALLPKISGALSFVGSTYIIVHSLRRKNRPLTSAIYLRLVTGMSSIDVLSSFAYFLSTWPIPRDTPNYPWAVGNHRTCAAQGFFTQLGAATPLYNLSLSVYFYIVTTNGGRRAEERAKKVEPLLQIMPWIFGIVTASIGAGLGIYGPSSPWCWLSVQENKIRIAMHDIPLVFCTIASIICLVFMCLATWKQERKAKQWLGRASVTMSTNCEAKAMAAREMTLTRKVIAQALWYIVAFIITFFFPLVRFLVIVITGDGRKLRQIIPVPVVYMYCLCIPSQGFLNFLIYTRGHHIRMIIKWVQKVTMIMRSTFSQSSPHDQATAPADSLTDNAMEDPCARLASFRRCSRQQIQPQGLDKIIDNDHNQNLEKSCGAVLSPELSDSSIDTNSDMHETNETRIKAIKPRKEDMEDASSHTDIFDNEQV
uniref:G-protein coupled receptors family 1 profile domain-containing protein n=1 Tax=Trieres chinensis TaxID=1514140 RepID=A0A7S2AAJ2_TRICV